MSLQLSNNWHLMPFALMFFGVTSFAGCSGPPPEPMGSLTGTITSRGEICGNCRVKLNGKQGSKGKNVDESGKFEFTPIPLGDYVFTVYQQATNDPVEVFDKRIPK